MARDNRPHNTPSPFRYQGPLGRPTSPATRLNLEERVWDKGWEELEGEWEKALSWDTTVDRGEAPEDPEVPEDPEEAPEDVEEALEEDPQPHRHQQAIKGPGSGLPRSNILKMIRDQRAKVSDTTSSYAGMQIISLFYQVQAAPYNKRPSNKRRLNWDSSDDEYGMHFLHKIANPPKKQCLDSGASDEDDMQFLRREIADIKDRLDSLVEIVNEAQAQAKVDRGQIQLEFARLFDEIGYTGRDSS